MTRASRIVRAGQHLLLIVLLGAGCRPRAEPVDSRSIDELLGLMRERLASMSDVARWKWQRKQAITDPVRERELLDRLALEGEARGLEAAHVRAFFAAQIEAAKQIQRADFERWKRTPPRITGDLPDLAALRKRIDRVNDDLLEVLVEVGPLLATEDGRKTLDARAQEILIGSGIEAEVRATALAPLLDR